MIRPASCVAVLAALAGTALADEPPPPKPDPSAVSAGESNLESTSRRRGRNATAALGVGLTVGFGIDDAVGTGGSGSFRVGVASTDRLVINAELNLVILVHEVGTVGGPSERKENVDVNLMLGGQFYVNRSLWLRTGLGFGVFRARGIDDAMGGKRDVNLGGPAGLVGAGLDLVRLKRLSIGLEIMSITMLNREGILSTNGFLLNATFD